MVKVRKSLSLDKELLITLHNMWKIEVQNNIKEGKKIISESQFIENLIKKGIYARSVGL